MTTVTINGKRVVMTITEKARMLEVIDIHEENVLAVRSGSDPKTAYGVQHDGTHAHYCPCKSRVKCAHRIAVEMYLKAAYRALYPNDFYFAA